MTYKGKSQIGVDEPYGVSVYDAYVKGDFTPLPPPYTPVLGTENGEKAIVTDDDFYIEIV